MYDTHFTCQILYHCHHDLHKLNTTGSDGEIPFLLEQNVRTFACGFMYNVIHNVSTFLCLLVVHPYVHHIVSIQLE